MPEHRVGTQEEWRAERGELPGKGKGLTRPNDELAGGRGELPWGAGGGGERFEAARRGARGESGARARRTHRQTFR